MKKGAKKFISICAATLIACTFPITAQAATNGWQRNSYTWSYYTNGVEKTNSWLKENNKWYYFDNNGNMVIGWYIEDGKHYYFDWNSGAMLTGWQHIGSYWYYFAETSTAKNPLGSMYSHGWYWIHGKCYYFNSYGEMASNTTIGEYRVDSTGAWIEGDGSKNLIQNPQNMDDLIHNWNIKYGKVETPMGEEHLEFTYTKNDVNYNPYDYWIKTDWEGVSPYDIKYSINFTSSEKEQTIDILKNVQEEVAKDVENYLPNVKVTGGYHTGFHRYPSLEVGYETIRFLTWQNYNEPDIFADNKYEDAKVGRFRWNDRFDDYNFIEV